MSHKRYTLVTVMLPLISSLYTEGVITSEQRKTISKLAQDALLRDQYNEFYDFVGKLEQTQPRVSELREAMLFS